MYTDRRATVVVPGRGPSKDELIVQATVTTTGNGWRLRLEKGHADLGPSGDPRLQRAVRMICDLDALTLRALERQRKLVREIPATPKGPPPFSGSEMAIPLLTDVERQELYPFQEEGIRWLLNNPKGILGDDMGLGKTAQAIVAAQETIRRGAAPWVLVVAPRTLISNWESEARRWAPELAVATMLEVGSNRKEVWRRLIGRAHLIITSYEQLRDPPAALSHERIALLIADEAHRLRNEDSLATSGVRSLDVERFWALTGTPLERDAEDIAVLMSLLEPQRFSADDARDHPTVLRARVRPYILRRRKEDVLEQMPTVVENNEALDLTTSQAATYAERIRNFASSGHEFLTLFNELRQICDMDPVTGDSSKLDRIVEVLEDVRALDEKAVVFSYLLDPLFALSNRLEQDHNGIGYQLLTGDMSLAERSSAVKRFSDESNCHALLASTRVGAEGLTLTAANHVIFVNRWWNPSANRQARDRVVRIGQQRMVEVLSFTCQGTVEERLQVLLDQKSISFSELVDQLSVEPSLREQLVPDS